MATTNKTLTQYRQKNPDKNFQNWIKASLVISFVKEGITKCVGTRIDQWHDEELYPDDRGDPCTNCTTENVLPCRTRGVCSMSKGRLCRFHSSDEKKFKSCSYCKGVKGFIVKRHKRGFPSWSNTRAERWSKYPWEIAKCYMPPNVYAHADTVNETDLNGILSVIINHKSFRGVFDLSKCEDVS